MSTLPTEEQILAALAAKREQEEMEAETSRNYRKFMEERAKRLAEERKNYVEAKTIAEDGPRVRSKAFFERHVMDKLGEIEADLRVLAPEKLKRDLLDLISMSNARQRQRETREAAEQRERERVANLERDQALQVAHDLGLIPEEEARGSQRERRRRQGAALASVAR